MPRCISAIAALSLLLPFTTAQSQWAQQPGGEWGYTQSLTTSGMFACLNASNYLPGGSCTAFGNTLTLVSGTSTMTITFTGSVQSVLATGTRSGPLVMGAFTKSFTGTPFTLPPVASVDGALFRFDLLLTSLSPFPTSDGISFGYTSRTGTSLPYDCCDYRTYAALRVLLPPEPLRYGAALYDTFTGADLRFDTSPTTITARVGLIPEPTTVVLMMTGLACLTIVGRRRSGRPM